LIYNRYLREKERNESILAQFMGREIQYNERIHLMHANSGNFLDASSESPEYHSFSLKLATRASFSSVFILLPLYNTSSNTEKVQTNDGFRIQNIKTGYFANYTMEKGFTSSIDLNINQGILRDKSLFDLDYPRDELNSCVVVLTESSLIWHTKLIRTYNFKDEDKIISNDIVRLTLPHIQSEVSADYSYLVTSVYSGRKRSRRRSVC
jgi:hypothetical protein